MVTAKSKTRKVADLENSHQSTIRSAVLAAAESMPLCASAIYGLNMIMTEEVGTIGVDKYFRCYVAPKFIDFCVEEAEKVSKASPCKLCGATSHHRIALLAGAICHESWHLLREHFTRAKNQCAVTEAQSYIWNVAADSEINDGLLEVFPHSTAQHKLCLPDFAILPKLNNLEPGKLAEEYYHKLFEEYKKKNPPCGTCKGTGKVSKKQGKGNQPGQNPQSGQGQNPTQGQGQGQGQGQNPTQGQGQNPTQGQGQNPTQGQGQGQGQGQDNGQGQGHSHGSGTDSGHDSCPDCGGSGVDQPKYGQTNGSSGSDGIERSYEAGEPGPDNPDYPGLSEIETKMVRKEVAKNIQEAAKHRGTVPGGWKLWADEQLGAPKYDWRKELRKVVTRAINTVPGDKFRTFKRLNRRCSSLGHKVILPSHHDSVPLVGIVQDTSGSMGKDSYRISFEETMGILKHTQTPVKYINCDMRADKAQTIRKVKDIDLHGGGGTDMRIGIKAALEEHPRPDIIILFTDGYTPWPDKRLPVGVQLVVCLVGKESCQVNEVPQWARVVKIVDEVVDKREAR